MVIRIHLKRLLRSGTTTAGAVETMMAAMGSAIRIEDAAGRRLLGAETPLDPLRHPIEWEGDTLGYVIGDRRAAAIADLVTHLVAMEVEKKTLGNEVLGSYRELNLIYDFSERLAASLDIHAVTSMALEQASQLITASGGAVLLLDGTGNTLSTAATWGKDQVPANLDVGQGIIGAIAASGVAEIVNDVPADSRKCRVEAGIRSLVCAPLKVKSGIRGVIVLVSETPQSYTAGELKLLTSVAAQVVLATENAALHEELLVEATRHIEARRQELEIAVKERTAELERQKELVELLSEIGKELTASLDLDTIFLNLYEHVCRLADAAVFGVGLYHDDDNTVTFHLVMEKGRRHPAVTLDLGATASVAGWCIDQCKAKVIGDVRTGGGEFGESGDGASGWAAGVLTEYPASMIAIPLMVKERILGILIIQSYDAHAYGDYHIGQLQNLAAYTSIAIDNAEAYRKLDDTLQRLKTAQQQLVTQEKLASLGQLTAGIAHEIKNPLNFVNNFAALTVGLVEELKAEFEPVREAFAHPEDVAEILDHLQQNADKINHHGKRADSIIRSMLQHSPNRKGERMPTDINAMLEEDLNLAYHGRRAQDPTFNITIERDFEERIAPIEAIPQDISRVFLNIITNGFYAAHKRRTDAGGDFSPLFRVETRQENDRIVVRLRDNGTGIPKAILADIFTPFFTTKPTGEGTGLGLSISYDIIVHEHGGELSVDSEEGKYTEFTITLPTRMAPPGGDGAAGGRDA